jgi:hypothetical protein
MASYIPLLLDTLSRLESINTERGSVARNMAGALLFIIFGAEWFKEHVELNANPDPWMLNVTEAWLASHPVPPPDPRRIIHAQRVIRLGDAWFTIVNKRLQGLETLRQRFLTRNDTRASFAETEVASLLIHNGCSVRVVGESGVRGQDFDLAATVRGVQVSVEVTEIMGGHLSISTALNKLQGKRNQVPPDRPAVLYVHIPESWMQQRALSVLILDAAIRRFFFRSRRYNMVVLMWETFRFTPDGGVSQMFFQPVYNNRARFKIPDCTVFSVKRDTWGMMRNSKSLLDTLRSFRMRQQAEAG